MLVLDKQAVQLFMVFLFYFFLRGQNSKAEDKGHCPSLDCIHSIKGQKVVKGS